MLYPRAVWKNGAVTENQIHLTYTSEVLLSQKICWNLNPSRVSGHRDLKNKTENKRDSYLIAVQLNK